MIISNSDLDTRVVDLKTTTSEQEVRITAAEENIQGSREFAICFVWNMFWDALNFKY